MPDSPIPLNDPEDAHGSGGGGGHRADEDLDLDFDAVLRPSSRRAAAWQKEAEEEAAAEEEEATWVKKRVPAERKAPNAKLIRLEHKSGEGLKPFTRFITRPVTTVAANQAASRAPAERVIPSDMPMAPAFQKSKGRDVVGYSPNRLQDVIDNTFQHSRIGWLDHMGLMGRMVAAGFICLIVGVLLWQYGKQGWRAMSGLSKTRVVDANVELSVPESERMAAVRKVFDEFLGASTAEAKMPLVIDSARIAARMRDYYETRGEVDPKVGSYEVDAPIRAGKEWWFSLQLKGPDGSISRALMKETPEGAKLDWENFVAYGSMPWAGFCEGKPVVAQSMRVRIRPAKVYAGMYNKEEYYCFEIEHQGGPPVLQGYARRASRTGQSLAAYEVAPDWQAVNLYLQWDPEGGAPTGVIIADLIRNNWLDSLNSGESEAEPIRGEVQTPEQVTRQLRSE